MAAYNTYILNKQLYGREIRTTYTQQERKFHTFHLHCLRRILHISWQDSVPNTEVLFCAGLPSMYTILGQRRLRRLGHVRLMEDSRIPKDILCSELTTGQRAKGRTQLRYKDVCKRGMKAVGINTDTREELAVNAPNGQMPFGYTHGLEKTISAVYWDCQASSQEGAHHRCQHRHCLQVRHLQSWLPL